MLVLEARNVPKLWAVSHVPSPTKFRRLYMDAHGGLTGGCSQSAVRFSQYIAQAQQNYCRLNGRKGSFTSCADCRLLESSSHPAQLVRNHELREAACPASSTVEVAPTADTICEHGRVVNDRSANGSLWDFAAELDGRLRSCGDGLNWPIATRGRRSVAAQLQTILN